MKLIDRDIAIQIFGPPPEPELRKFLDDNGFPACSTDPQDDYTGNYTLSCAIYWSLKRHPDAEMFDVCSFSGLVQGYSSGFFGGFGTDGYKKEQIIRNIILSVHGGTPAQPGEMFSVIPAELVSEGHTVTAEQTEKIIGILDHCYFGNLVESVSDLIETSTPEAAAVILISMATTASEYKETCQTAHDFLKRKKTIGDLRKSIKKIADKLDWIKTSILLEIPVETLNDIQSIARLEKRSYYRVAEDILRIKAREHLDRIIANIKD